MYPNFEVLEQFELTVNHALLVPEGSFSSQGKGPESGYKIYNQASQNLPFCLMMLRDNLLVS